MTSPAIDNHESLEELLLPILEKLERKEYELPALPQVAIQVLGLTTDPDANAAQLTTVIQQDPVLTSKIFQAANSAALGPQRKIESLQQAIAWLGLNNVAGSAFSLSVQSGVFNVSGYEREVKALWTHALATGRLLRANLDSIRTQLFSVGCCMPLESPSWSIRSISIDPLPRLPSPGRRW